jgi:hypothetical protein
MLPPHEQEETKMRLTIVLLSVLILLFNVGPALCQPEATTGEQPEKITLDFRDADLREALDALFRGRPQSYLLDPDVSGRVTLSLKDVPWNAALRSILDSNGLEYSINNNIYRVFRKPPETPVSGAFTGTTISSSSMPTPTMPTSAVSPRRALKIEVIQLQHADPAEIAALFGGYAVSSGFGGMGAGLGSYGIGGVYGGGGIGGGYGGYGGGYGGVGGGYGGYGGTSGYGGYGGGGYGGYGGTSGYGGYGGGGYGGIGGISGIGGYGGAGRYGGYGGTSGYGSSYGGYGAGRTSGYGGIGGGYAGGGFM